jgi:MFS family permease
MANTQNSNYRWYVLGLGTLAYFFIAGMSRMCMPVLFKEISADLGLSMVAIGVVWGMDPLAGVLIGLPGGLLADRFGVKRTMVAVCIMAGIFGAMRGLSFNFLTMATTMFLFGLMVATMPSIVPKITAVWFHGKELGISNALLNIVWGLGSMSATMFSATFLSPLLGSWRNVMFLYGIPCVLLGLLWLITGREPVSENGTSKKASSIPFKQSLSSVLKIRPVWIIGLITLTFWGSSIGMIGYLPVYLRDVGWSHLAADSAITVLSGVSALGAIPVILIADRSGSRKGVLMMSIMIMTSTMGLLPFMTGTGVWILLVINGFLRTGLFALFNVMILQNREVGVAYSGTAVGLVSTFGMVGAFLAPPLGNSLTAFGPGLPFILWAALSAMGLPMFLFLKDE